MLHHEKLIMVNETTLSQTEARLNSHEAVCAVRYEGINARLKRLEQILIGACGFIIAILLGIALKL
jgi:hypothetical protein